MGFLSSGGGEIMSFNSTRFIQYPGCQCSGRKKPSLHLGGLAAAVSDVKVGSRSHTAARLLYARRKNGGFWSRLRASRSSLGAAKRPSWVRVVVVVQHQQQQRGDNQWRELNTELNTHSHLHTVDLKINSHTHNKHDSFNGKRRLLHRL